MSGARLDKLLWMLRYFKTRKEAMEACQGGRVKRGGKSLKPAKIIAIGDEISLSKSPFSYTFRVLDIPRQRLPASQLEAFRLDLSPPQTAVLNDGKVLRKGQAKGRPTKKDRRNLEGFQGHEN